MDNNDYKKPESDYSSTNEYTQTQAYTEPQEHTQSYGYNQFQTEYNYYNNYNGNGEYTNMGGAVIDYNGKELKNHFGIKLTLSILEMLCCCTSCITLIMGIIACVFTCQANSSFREGRYEDFKSKAKTSTILLIVGGVVAAIVIIFNAVSFKLMKENGFWDTFMEEYEKALEEELGTDIDMDTFWDDVYEGKYDELYEESPEVDDYGSDYIEGVYHLDSDDINDIAIG